MESEVPADASSLIYLAKADAFDIAGRVMKPMLAPPSVWREAVLAGEEVGAAEVPRIVLAERQGLVRRIDLSDSEQRLATAIATQNRLGSGESEVLTVTPAGALAIVDEGRATRVARSRGITPISTLFLPIIGRDAGDLDHGQAVDLLRRVAAVIGVRSDVTLALEQELQRRKR
jgi:hypothetical protein